VVTKEQIVIELNTRFTGEAELQKAKQRLLELRAIQMGAAAAGVPEPRQRRLERQVLADRINRQDRERARAQREVLFSGLGVMFFMMAMNRVLMDMVQPAADIAGIFELIGLIFTLLFLPIMIKLIPILVSAIKFVGGLSEEMKLLIGGLVLVGIAVTSVLGFLAQLSLGIQSIGMAGAAVSTLSGVMTALVAALTAPITLILALAAAFALLIANRDKVLEMFGVSLAGEQQRQQMPLATFGQELAAANELTRRTVAGPLGPGPGGLLALPELIGADVRALQAGLSALNINIFNSAGVQTTSANVDQIGGRNPAVNITSSGQ
jgi:hypothetical protein